MEFILLKEDSLEWGYMWDMLRLHPINAQEVEPCVATNEGEVWQYMGTFRNKETLISEFRHIKHPYTQELYKITFSHVLHDESSIGQSKRIK